METFKQGYRLGQGDLLLYLYARYNNAQPYQTFPFTPFWIRYDIGYTDQNTNTFMYIGARDRLPDILDTGKVRPNFIINDTWKPGVYDIHWHYTATQTSPVQTVIGQFTVVSDGIHQANLAMENHFDLRAFMVLD